MKRANLHIKGLVQGVGFRPFVYTLALKYDLKGFVANSTKGVHVEIEGDDSKIKSFICDLKQFLPPLARIDKLDVVYVELKNDEKFTIKKSENEDTKSGAILPDQAICEDCLKELKDETNRRFEYPFINCTNCGPRYSIIKDIPYDRPYTSMAKFPMCEECKKEYENPLDRRYHAQPISCKNCGPVLSLHVKNEVFFDENIIQKTAKLIKNGEIVAIKGVGGFHLICDATQDEPIKRLRDFKARPFKPFAVMTKDLEMAKECVLVNSHEENALNSIEKPIVLVEKKDSNISHLVAPHTQRLGIFLPNTPLHVILFNFLSSPIIATSANLKSEPIITKKEDLDEKFGEIVSAVLDYDREILHPCDDSVLQMVGEKRLFLRVSRGIAPLTLPFKGGEKTLLAVGATQKNAIAFYFDGKIVLSPYLGSMETLKTFELFKNTIASWKRFYGLKFDEIIHDKHPTYATTKWAKSQNIKTISVNHYHAHILATLIDRNLPLNTEVLGVAWDGTGYGDDGTIWGGEFLHVKGREYKRVAHFKPFKLLGGEKSIKHIYRIAFSMLLDINEDVSEFEGVELLSQMHKKNINAPLCSSVGRLFDAVCYLATGLKEVSYDGESGLLLESLYDENIEEFYTLHVKNGVINYDNMLREILKDRKLKNSDTLIASKFINTLAKIITTIVNKHNLPIALGGGVFQNKTLLLKLEKQITSKPLHFPQTLTPNDGSVCVGQLAFGLLKDNT